MKLSPRWIRALRPAAWGWTAMIFVLLWMPPPPPPPVVWWWWDKLVHLGLLTGFGALWTWRGLRGAYLWPAGVLVGAASEAGQGLLPWRHSSWDDFAFDVLGLVVGVVIGRLLWLRPDDDRPAWW